MDMQHYDKDNPGALYCEECGKEVKSVFLINYMCLCDLCAEEILFILDVSKIKNFFKYMGKGEA